MSMFKMQPGRSSNGMYTEREATDGQGHAEHLESHWFNETLDRRLPYLKNDV